MNKSIRKCKYCKTYKLLSAINKNGICINCLNKNEIPNIKLKYGFRKWQMK